MTLRDQLRALSTATAAARAAGKLMRQNLARPKRVNEATQHDIKLELDVRCQKLIEKRLAAAFPQIPLLGEEGDSGDVTLEYRWVIDPIDGTVNYAYGIPHAGVCIALQRKVSSSGFGVSSSVKRARGNQPETPNSKHETILGVIYDPFADEIWTATHNGPARLNGRVIHVSDRCKLADCLVTTGFAKSKKSVDEMLPFFGKLAYSVRKVRMMGSAALALTYVASGRLDAYIESRVNLWDIAAGGLILERAGGEFWKESLPEGENVFRLIANNGRVRKELQRMGLFRK